MKPSRGANSPKPACAPRETCWENAQAHVCTNHPDLVHSTLPSADRAPGSGDRVCPVELSLAGIAHHESEPLFRGLLCNKTFLDLLVSNHSHGTPMPACPLSAHLASLLIYSLSPRRLPAAQGSLSLQLTDACLARTAPGTGRCTGQVSQ